MGRLGGSDKGQKHNQGNRKSTAKGKEKATFCIWLAGVGFG